MVIFATFGQTHKHPLTGRPMKDYWVKIYTHNRYLELRKCGAIWGSPAIMDTKYVHMNIAGSMMAEKFFSKWSALYTLDEFDEIFFPKGCIQIMGTPTDEEIFDERLKEIYDKRRYNREIEESRNNNN